MKKLEKYLGNKTYMFPIGTLATPEIMEEQYPAIKVFTHVIETDEAGQVCFAIQNLSALRSMYNIDSSLTEDEAIAKIEEIINTEPKQVESAEERSARALEEMASGATSESTELMNILLTGEESSNE